MRRWQAIPVAAIAAFVVGAALFSTQYRSVSAAPSAVVVTPTAVVPTPITFQLDCGPAAGIQASCTFPSGTGTVDIGVYIQNNSGADISVASFNFDLVTHEQLNFNPGPISGDASNSNPDFNEAGFAGSTVSCALSPPQRDNNASTAIADSKIICFAPTGSLGNPIVTTGTSLLLGTVHYLVTADGVGTFTLSNTQAGDNSGAQFASCEPNSDFPVTCVGADVQVGASAATATPVNTATNTPTATPTCVGAACPTGTSVAFVTVTPVGTPTLQPPPTSPAGAASPVGANPPPATGPDGSQPGGNAGAGGARPIRLPDTGTGANGTNWSSILLIALAAVAAAGIAGGAYLGTIKVSGARRPGDED